MTSKHCYCVFQRCEHLIFFFPFFFFFYLSPLLGFFSHFLSLSITLNSYLKVKHLYSFWWIEYLIQQESRMKIWNTTVKCCAFKCVCNLVDLNSVLYRKRWFSIKFRWLITKLDKLVLFFVRPWILFGSAWRFYWRWI